MSVGIASTAFAELAHNFPLFDECDRIEHWRHLDAVISNIIPAITGGNDSPISVQEAMALNHEMVNGRILMRDLLHFADASQTLDVIDPDDDAESFSFEASDTLSHREANDATMLYDKLCEASHLLGTVIIELDDDDERTREVLAEPVTVLFQPATSGYECPVCLDDKDESSRCWICSHCGINVCADCMNHWVGTTTSFHVDEDYEYDSHSHHNTCPHCNMVIDE
jgi:hypothetical protein